MSLRAASSLGNCPLVLIALRSLRLSASMAFVSGMKGARCHRGSATGPFQLLSASGLVSTVRPSGSRGVGSERGWAGRSYTLRFERELVLGRPCDLPGCASSADP
jgi:hypothetical protein